MSGKFCVSLMAAKNDTDKATVAFVVANAALGSGQETLVFLSTEAVRLAVRTPSTLPAASVELPVFRGGHGLRAGVNLDSGTALLDIMDVDRPRA